jgi:adhesin HecA-like repeat protein
MAEIKLPDIRPAKTIEGKMDALYDAYFVMRKFMTYYLSGNLDEENVVRAQEAVIANVLAGTIKADQIDVTEGKIQAAQIGTIKADQIDVTEGKIQAAQIGTIKADQIDVTEGKIQAAQIEDLVVGGNVTMGPNARISWSQVTNQPYIPTTADITTITANYIATPNLITNIAQVNNSLRLGSGATDAMLTFRSGASIYSFDTINGPYISFDVFGLRLAGNDIDCRGNWHFRNASVSGLENCGYVKQSDITAAIAAHVAAYHSS